MCTVTFIPSQDGNFIFTSNRDEAPKRSATEMVREDILGKEVLFPRDSLAKGTWIAIANSKQLVCILNGAFIKHKHQPPYKLSRGIMALEFFKYKNATDFFENFDFGGMEPFTMVIFDDERLYELRWDEKETHVKKLDPSKTHLWASCTLYADEWQEKRKQWFADWKQKYSVVNQNNVLDFHRNAGEGNSRYDVVMNYKDIVRTTSITSIINTNEKMSLRYEDLLDGSIEHEDLEFR